MRIFLLTIFLITGCASNQTSKQSIPAVMQGAFKGDQESLKIYFNNGSLGKLVIYRSEDSSEDQIVRVERRGRAYLPLGTLPKKSAYELFLTSDFYTVSIGTHLPLQKYIFVNVRMGTTHWVDISNNQISATEKPNDQFKVIAAGSIDDQKAIESTLNPNERAEADRAFNEMMKPQRQIDEANQRQLKIQQERNETIVKKEEERIAREGDLSPDDLLCKKYGLKPQTNGYAECRMRLDFAKAESIKQQQQYEREQAAYQEQMAGIQKERERQRAMKQLELGLRIIGGQSPVDAVNSVGTGAPIAPRAPTPTNQTITLPNGRMINCSTFGTMTNCF